MQLVIPIDVEVALAEDVHEHWQHLTFAPPAPDSLGNSLPCAQVFKLGGGQRDRVADMFAVSIDVWALTFEEAMDEARTLAGIVKALPFSEPASGRHWLAADVTTNPYINVDPLHPSIPRATFAAVLEIRGELSTI